jgi:hypothetical protein
VLGIDQGQFLPSGRPHVDPNCFVEGQVVVVGGGGDDGGGLETTNGGGGGGLETTNGGGGGGGLEVTNGGGGGLETTNGGGGGGGGGLETTNGGGGGGPMIEAGGGQYDRGKDADMVHVGQHVIRVSYIAYEWPGSPKKTSGSAQGDPDSMATQTSTPYAWEAFIRRLVRWSSAVPWKG